ncbi:putative proline-specific permease [Salmonella enterica subsp. enterica serovar Sanjuan]|uniref:Putative proline-specific permease n=1 Tax=Salmonella enterica subsp. enterica serovar Sanjuan TaxID=1160765 RepID=A0A3S4IUV3_SALET|nr:putative proline-specific permease [Salmonella enterica subsp. enterica serovar Sanjuan]
MPHWVWVLSVVLIICAINLMSVKVFGELEFWFSFFKVATIIIMIVAGIGIIVWGIGNGGQPTGIHNLWSNGGFFSNGWLGMIMSLQMVMFAYGGIEIIGITAGKRKTRKNPFRAPLTQYRCVSWYFMSARCSSLCLSIRGIRSAQTAAHLC